MVVATSALDNLPRHGDLLASVVDREWPGQPRIVQARRFAGPSRFHLFAHGADGKS
jgi:hypothetical protein